MYSDWQKKEEDFHLEQTKERSRIRLLGNREKPIDTIAKNVLLIEAAASVGKRDETEYSAAKNVSLLELDVELRNPLSVVENTDLSEEELRQLADDVTAYLQLERNHAAKVPMSAGSPSYEAFWEALHVIVKAELLSVRGNVRGLHAAVEGEIQQLLAGKTPQELTDMQTDIERDLANGRSKDTVHNALCIIFILLGMVSSK